MLQCEVQAPRLKLALEVPFGLVCLVLAFTTRDIFKDGEFKRAVVVFEGIHLMRVPRSRGDTLPASPRFAKR